MNTEIVTDPTMEYYRAIKRNRLWIHVPTWGNRKDMLSESSFTQKKDTLRFHLYEGPAQAKRMWNNMRTVAGVGAGTD